MKEKTINFIKGFKYAFSGILIGARGRNMKVHLAMALFVLLSGMIVDLSYFEWIIVSLLIALVISAELFNTAVEELADLIREHEGLEYKATKTARDLAAGGVLVLATISAIIGLAIFLPNIF